MNLSSLFDAVTATAFSARAAPSGSGVMVEQAAKLARVMATRLRDLNVERVMLAFVYEETVWQDKYAGFWQLDSRHFFN